MDEKHQFMVGMFDERGNVLVSDNRYSDSRYKLHENEVVPSYMRLCGTQWHVNEVVPAYMGFYTNSGTLWDVEVNEAKMQCLSYLRGRFYFDYTLELAEKESKFMIADGKMFNPIPEAESLAGLVFKMDLMKYGKR